MIDSLTASAKNASFSSGKTCTSCNNKRASSVFCFKTSKNPRASTINSAQVQLLGEVGKRA